MSGKHLSRFCAFMIIAILLPIFSGCYTKVFKRKLSRNIWGKKHGYQYYPKTTWGKAWNSYYWSPSTKDFWGSSGKSSKSGKSPDRSGEYDDNSRNECVDIGCLFIDSADGCCLFPFLGNGDDDDDDDDSPDDPQRRRGMDSPDDSSEHE